MISIYEANMHVFLVDKLYTTNILEKKTSRNFPHQPRKSKVWKGTKRSLKQEKQSLTVMDQYDAFTPCSIPYCNRVACRGDKWQWMLLSVSTQHNNSFKITGSSIRIRQSIPPWSQPLLRYSFLRALLCTKQEHKAFGSNFFSMLLEKGRLIRKIR